MKWEILDTDAMGRIGKLEINGKEMDTPNLFPVLHPYKNIISSSEFKKLGAQCVFTNSYIIHQNANVKEQVLKRGLHRYLEFDGIIATDSGAFQQYIYNNTDFEINAEEIEKFQELIRSDFPVILDLPVQPNDDYNTAKKKIITTIERARNNIDRRTNLDCTWFGPIHGAKYLDLLEFSTVEMSKLDFGVLALGGLVKYFLNYRYDLVLKALLTVKKAAISNRPLHLFGLGLPQFFSLAILCGCDLMDSAAYVLYAKENRYFTLSTGTKQLDELKEFPCICPICLDYTPKELKSLDKVKRTELLAKHNLYVSFAELRTIRQAIKEGNLWELVEQRIRSHPALVNALKSIKDNLVLFEIHEKTYKPHGRLFVSSDSVNRPLIYRYVLKLNLSYRPPTGGKLLIILPELDVKVEYSPSIKKWLKNINENSIIPRKLLHVVFLSDFFGIIPLELSYTFPMGQSELIVLQEKDNVALQNIVKKVGTYFNTKLKHYDMCGLFIPDKFINQFDEITEFTKTRSMEKIIPFLKSKFNSNFTVSNEIPQLLHFFKERL